MIVHQHLRSDGNWLQILRTAPHADARPALFLDRDGVVVMETGYLRRAEDVALLPGAAACIAGANRAGWCVVVITNQSGIGRGYYGWDDFVAVQEAIFRKLAAAQAQIDMVLACPYHAEAVGNYQYDNHPWRKPRPGMLLAAAEALPIDMARSWIVGDHANDIAAGRAAGLAGGFHVLTGHGAAQRQAALAAAGPSFPVVPVSGIGEVATHLRLRTAPEVVRGSD